MASFFFRLSMKRKPVLNRHEFSIQIMLQDYSTEEKREDVNKQREIKKEKFPLHLVYLLIYFLTVQEKLIAIWYRAWRIFSTSLCKQKGLIDFAVIGADVKVQTMSSAWLWWYLENSLWERHQTEYKNVHWYLLFFDSQCWGSCTIQVTVRLFRNNVCSGYQFMCVQKANWNLWKNP